MKRGKTMKNIKKLVMVMVVMALVMSAMSFEAKADEAEHGISLEAKHGMGFNPVHKKVTTSKKSKRVFGSLARVFPSKYRSDEQEWAEGIRIKDQDESGLCWAFATTTAAEYSWAKESYDRLGPVEEMSPGHLGYFLFNRANDPLGNTAGDFNYDNYKDTWPLAGGSMLDSAQHLATYSGVGLESNTPFDLIISHITDGEWEKGYKPYEGKRAYDNYATLQNSDIYLYGIDKNELKEKVYDYGAVTLSLEFGTSTYMNYDETDEEGQKYKYGRSYYAYEETNPNHAVTIIGWDDDYPASNFTCKVRGYSDEKSYAMTTPPGDGAWVVQNSWGTDVHENGIFYMSYYSQNLNEDSMVVSFDMQDASTYDYNFQYDGTSDCGDSSDEGNERFFTRAGSSAANIYTNDTRNPIEVRGVGYSTFTDDSAVYKISVYKHLTDPSDPTSGRLAGTTTATSKSAGVFTAVLDTPIPIDVGETYSVVFSFPNANHFGVEKERVDYTARVDKNQSFFRKKQSDQWKDVADYDACFRIKALANIIDDYYEPDYPPEPTTVPVETTTSPIETTTAAATTKATYVVTTAAEKVDPKQAKTKIKKVVAKKKALKFKLKKVKGVSGYQVQVATDKKFKKNKKVVTTKNNKKLTVTVKKLKAKKKYYARVRTYKKADGVRVYSKWSGKKSKKTK